MISRRSTLHAPPSSTLHHIVYCRFACRDPQIKAASLGVRTPHLKMRATRTIASAHLRFSVPQYECALLDWAGAPKACLCRVLNVLFV